ncbi:hypothetical protein SI65_03302 [Aspergillus cristatus]|uniref:MULE transposase domain-containing protein n=1 Tax=Aspergillus cristatus TaxID=573508 RepID=A0A1E3BH39_ASPCR|nr:hypothetical protein SI65_03302 [Aspergillus cristatus]
MMLAHLKALDLLMKLFVFALCLIPTLAYPVNPSDVDLPDGMTIFEKRTLNPPLPTLEEARKHVKSLPKDKSIFYLGECQKAASYYGSKNGMVMLANADDGSGWMQFEGGGDTDTPLSLQAHPLVKQLGYHHNKDNKSAPLGYPQLHASELNMVNTTHQQPLQALLAEYLSDDEDPCPQYSLPPPPADAIYPSEKEAMDAINEFTKQHGYALTTKSSKRHEGDGQIKACYLHCNCSGVYKNNIADNEQTDKWSFEIKGPGHNHSPAPVHTHPTLRRAEIKKCATTFENQLAAGITPCQILDTAKRENKSNIIPQDIYNFRQDLHHKFLDGRTPIQALLTALPKEGKWLFNHMKDIDGHVVGLFCTHQSCLELLQSNPYLLIMDCTYKTNKYRMPMLDINGVTATGSTFFAAVAFIHNEQQPSYDFALTSLCGVYEQLGLEPPCTILTDKEKALINACKGVFPDAYTMICLWHVNKNILSKARPIIHKELLDSMETLPDRHDKEANAAMDSQADKRWKRMLEMWWKVVRAPSYPESEHAWKEFHDQYDDEIFGPLVAYIEKEWLNDDTQKQILYCFTDKAFHLDMRTTSCGEASHSHLKKDLA